MVKSFFFYAQRKGAAVPVDYLSTFATAPVIIFSLRKVPLEDDSK